MNSDSIVAFSTWVLPVLIAISFHEASHGLVASWCGDDTAKKQGRVTFNPAKHIDLFGTIILPGMLLLTGLPPFGWAKPVPVDFSRLNNLRRDTIFVAIAGPGINFMLAIVAAALLHTLPLFPEWLKEWIRLNLVNAIIINISLALFNLLPIPPLDGGRILTSVLPIPLARKFVRVERYGILIVLLLIMLPVLLSSTDFHFNPLAALLGEPVEKIGEAILRLVHYNDFTPA